MAYTNELQLLPEKRSKVELRSPGRSKMFNWGLISITIVAALGFSLFYLKSGLEQDIASIDLELNANEAKRDKKFEGDILILKKQLGVVSGLLKNHVYWSQALIGFENSLLDRVQVTMLELSKNESKIKFSGLG